MLFGMTCRQLLEMPWFTQQMLDSVDTAQEVLYPDRLLIMTVPTDLLLFAGCGCVAEER